MTTSYRVRGTVPPDSPLTALAGRTVTVPAESLEDLLRRVKEMRAARVEPLVQLAPGRPWTGIAWAFTATTLAAVLCALAAILAGEHALAWVSAGAMVLAWLGIFAAVTHLEMGR